ncbi:transposase [Patescibacteria group bacterium]|nr:transposase [Patescibacteria group bacterium]
MNFIEFEKKFPSEREVIDCFLNIRYPNGVKCNFCNSENVYRRKDMLKVFNCAFCNKTFSPLKNTIFEKTSTDLKKWFYAIQLFFNSKNEITAKQLQREIKVEYKTAWRILLKIRIAMENKFYKDLYEAVLK